ncbi:unnamed protein product [Symbiodinium sp. CCMP2592]|nr:unnamed protein product [Symbiodinium sp. CCMP2592]
MVTWPSDVDIGTLKVETCLHTANMCVAALNCLNQSLKPALAPEALTARPTLAQLSAHRHVASRVVRFLARLNSELGDALPWRGSFSEEELTAASNCQDICADAVDLPVAAGTCEPLDVIAPGLASQIVESETVFPHCHPLASFPEVSPEKRGEYVALAVRELQCGKLRLRPDACAVADVFAAAKRHGRQRKIWDGSQISGMAADPPKPRRLANPSCFLELEVKATETLFFSKRDASTFFDVLRVPRGLQPWLAQPALTVSELLSVGLIFDHIQAFCDDVELLSEETMLYPTHVEELALVATDDTVLFHRDRHRGAQTLRNLDAAFEANGIPRNSRKDVSLAASITALGCDLSNQPPLAEPAAARLCQARGFYSIYSDIYGFVQRIPERLCTKVPAGVLNELLATLLLSPLSPLPCWAIGGCTNVCSSVLACGAEEYLFVSAVVLMSTSGAEECLLVFCSGADEYPWC